MFVPPALRKAFFAALLALCTLWGTPSLANPKLLVDMHTGAVLYAEDAGQPWHPASLTKLMTAYVTFRAIAEGRVGPNTPVILSREAVKMPPAHTGLPVDSTMTLHDALYVLLVKSANDMAVAIAQTVDGNVQSFVDEMNHTAQQMGLTSTHYVDPNGLHANGQTVSARDLAVLTLTILARYPQYADIFQTDGVRIGKRVLRTHNNLLTDFPGATGMKTGFICAAGLNVVATARRGGRDLMAVVLGASSERERAQMAAQLLDKGFSGELTGSGTNILDLENQPNMAPTDMRNDICGAGAKAYVAERAQAFPYGLKGEPSYLQADSVAPRIYEATLLGRFRDVPLPQPRPLWAPAAISKPAAVAAEAVKGTPLPKPRPGYRLGG